MDTTYRVAASVVGALPTVVVMVLLAGATVVLLAAWVHRHAVAECDSCHRLHAPPELTRVEVASESGNLYPVLVCPRCRG